MVFLVEYKGLKICVLCLVNAAAVFTATAAAADDDGIAADVRSGMGAYAGAVRRRVHLATVLLRPPSVHRPGRR